MALLFSQEFKLQSVKKALSRRDDQTLKSIASDLGVGYSTLQKWIRLAKNNQLEHPEKMPSTEKSPQDWSKSERLEAIMSCHALSEEQESRYCRENGLYPHHLKEWKAEFVSATQGPVDPLEKKEKKALQQDIKRLQKELNRKDKALSETAALLVLSKKCQAIWGEKEDV